MAAIIETGSIQNPTAAENINVQAVPGAEGGQQAQQGQQATAPASPTGTPGEQLQQITGQHPAQPAAQQPAAGDDKPFVGSVADVGNIVAREVKTAVAGVFAKLGVPEGDYTAGKAALAAATQPAQQPAGQQQTQQPDPGVAALQAQLASVQEQLAYAGQQPDPKFAEFVKGEVAKMPGGVTAENVAKYKSENAQFFPQKIVRVASSPSLQGGAVPNAGANDGMNEFIRGRGQVPIT